MSNVCAANQRASSTSQGEISRWAPPVGESFLIKHFTPAAPSSHHRTVTTHHALQVCSGMAHIVCSLSRFRWSCSHQIVKIFQKCSWLVGLHTESTLLQLWSLTYFLWAECYFSLTYSSWGERVNSEQQRVESFGGHWKRKWCSTVVLSSCNVLRPWWSAAWRSQTLWAQ